MLITLADLVSTRSLDDEVRGRVSTNVFYHVTTNDGKNRCRTVDSLVYFYVVHLVRSTMYGR